MQRPRTVPSSRLSRLAGFGRLAGGIAGNVLGGGAREMLKGQRPDLPSLLLNPANARRLADELARLRGAAMKLGQLISMDGGEVLPRELADILARLRAEADPMPEKQLEQALVAGWGPDWRRQFQQFDMAPMAAASIGQVHRAVALDGRDLAIKVQYPGIAASIDADVDNVATLVKLSGLLPAGFALDPLLADAKRQLHDEADYAREAMMLERYAAQAKGWPGVAVPALAADLSRPNILAMGHVGGVGIDKAAALPQAERDRLMTLMLRILMAELFDWRMMQTDPNFANYRYDLNNGRLVLLDFGAARDVPAAVSDGYRALLAAGLAADDQALLTGLASLGILPANPPAAMTDAILGMARDGFAPLRMDGAFDFGGGGLAANLKAQSSSLVALREHFIAPPPDVLFIQRKIAGMYLLAARLKARVDVAALVRPYTEPAADSAPDSGNTQASTQPRATRAARR
ncbi:AarF/ABC1/UbiB kinase family protein [Sandarakinorhabdus sp.]|uniref:ABC1 kinase family protein n=1 Tax=Sandarakinorhabdus sp. TaxID=1916663 RepID=UPI00286E7B3B|nr:AarF/ABC1/UbiB kinase family protein [Sandarakinorhabdus sp.]